MNKLYKCKIKEAPEGYEHLNGQTLELEKTEEGFVWSGGHKIVFKSNQIINLTEPKQNYNESGE